MNAIDRLAGSSPFDAIRREDADGTEWWSARDLQPVMGYSVWRDFANAVERAKAACANSGIGVEANFAGARKVVASGPAAEDYRLSRYACYLTAMNGDPRKREIADAQTYFAVRTREAETRSASAFEIPQTYAQALRAAADAAERAEIAEARAQALEPAAHAWGTLATAHGDYDVARAAQILSRDPALKIGRTRLFTWLANHGWIYRGAEGRWCAYQEQIDRGRLMILPSSHYHPRTGDLVLDPPQVRVTVKGLEYLHRVLGGSGQLALDEWAAADA